MSYDDMEAGVVWFYKCVFYGISAIGIFMVGIYLLLILSA